MTERFDDQFSPMLVTQDISSSSSNSTVIRMPLSSKCMTDLETGCKKVNQIFDRFMQNASSTLLFLRSILQVHTQYMPDDLIIFTVAVELTKICALCTTPILR